MASTDQQDLQLARAGFVAELDEIFMDATASWDPGNSDGEGLSRVLSFDLYPPLDAAAQLFETVPTWLLTVNHFGNRRDWVTRPEPTDLDYDSIGCASLFLNWLRYDLHFGWHEIINASGIEQYGPVLFPISATLALRYDMLTGDTGGFYRFDVRTDALVPGRQVGPGADRLPVEWNVRLNADNAFPATLQVTGVGGNGHLMHSLWDPADDWTPFRPVADAAGEPGLVFGAAAGGVNGDMQLAVATGDGTLLHTLRPVAGQPWTQFRPIAAQAGDPGPVTAVAAAGVANEMQIAAVTATGKIVHTIRHARGNWEPFRTLGKPRPELNISSMAGAGVQGEFHLLFAYNESIYHTIRHFGGGWDPLIDSKTKTGDPGRSLSKVAGTEVGSDLYVLASIAMVVFFTHFDVRMVAGTSGSPWTFRVTTELFVWGAAKL